ncbi:MAG: VOC family protein [Anaerolineales bacterium]|nr:VOC family protein [Anaerolineales bacterium]MCB9129156.1 VOC family protein [Ardenticatenales bacterium]
MSITIVGLDHLQLAMPRGGEAAARHFYGTLLGLREVTKPPTLRAAGGCWFEGKGISFHLGVEEPFTPARKAHPALRVSDLDAALSHLAAAGIEITRDQRVPEVRRAYIHDPFGNRIELLQAGDRYPSGEG